MRGSKTGVATAGGHMGAAAQRIGLSFVLLGIVGVLLQDRIRALDLALAIETLGAVQAGQWLAALAAVGLSFWAIGRYDGVVHQHLGTAVPLPEARRAGIAAIAISQTVGAGVVTGSLVRWRMLRGVSLWQATRLSVAVALSFLVGWGVVTGAVLAVLTDGKLWLAGCAMTGVGLVMFVLGARPPAALQRLDLPHAITQARLIGLTLVDTFAACLALYLLLPDSAGLSFAALLPAFLLATGIGLASGTPGGVGPFEVSLIGLLPMVPEAPLLAAVMGWRLVYFAIPALIAGVVVALGPALSARGPDRVLRAVLPARQDTLIARSRRAEAGLARQGQLGILESRLGGAWVAGRTRHALIGLFDPIGTDLPRRAALYALAHQAASEGRSAAVYKCDGRTAAMARRSGWHVVPLGREALINPARFVLTGAALGGLRRKLRRADAAGLTLRQGDVRGQAERAAIARLWAKARKGERGFSMGRYDESYLAGQLVIEARQHGKLVAFVTLHCGNSEWTLDLMRHGPDCPDGTMHALITDAILRAQTAGVRQVSLACAGLPGGLAGVVAHMAGADDSGLLRFKQLFAPVWRGRYLIAPSRFAALVAGAEIAMAVQSPPPITKGGMQTPLHHDLEPNEIAHGAVAWHTGA
ncbi:MAG: hypothetical protein RLZZ437_3346 [Pseudomonadota bacterium]|jgi:phosphatidylglycerol lysyltransferase